MRGKGREGREEEGLWVKGRPSLLFDKSNTDLPSLLPNKNNLSGYIRENVRLITFTAAAVRPFSAINYAV